VLGEMVVGATQRPTAEICRAPAARKSGAERANVTTFHRFSQP
jgi:hypothetical protein